jgi:hypothetical protein
MFQYIELVGLVAIVQSLVERFRDDTKLPTKMIDPLPEEVKVPPADRVREQLIQNSKHAIKSGQRQYRTP